MKSYARKRVNGADAASSSNVDVLYNIEVRGRPVQGNGGYIATHTFLVLLDQRGAVKESLSFDPSNSTGWSDNDPENHERGCVLIATNCSYSEWEKLSDDFKRRASEKPYVLANHNCCHAVREALVCSDLVGARAGAEFALLANNTWHSTNNFLSGIWTSFFGGGSSSNLPNDSYFTKNQ